MKKAIILGLVFLALLAGGIWYDKVYKPYLPDKEEKVFVIEAGENLFKIAGHLEQENLVSHRFFFISYVLAARKHKNLQAGVYLLNPAMSVRQIAKTIWGGKTANIAVTIPEGFTIKQIEEALQKAGFKNMGAKIGDQKVGQWKDRYWFLADALGKASLEGFLFPDTYHFPYQVKEEDIIAAMLGNFGRKITPELREDINRQGKTVFQIIIMASLLEKEVKTLDDQQIVSGILWKRLEAGMPLQVDATISYITGKRTTKISKEETEIDSPYNTYKYLGLPPGPIGNPGFDSILAAVHQTESNFWYYLSASDGETVFSRTLEEHNMAKAKYLK